MSPLSRHGLLLEIVTDVLHLILNLVGVLVTA